VVSHRPIAAEDRLRSQACRCENNGGRSGTGTGFSFIFIISPIFCTHAEQILLLAAGQKGEASGPSRNSALTEVGEAFDTYTSTFSCLIVALVWVYSSSNSIFVRPATYHQGSLLFFVFVHLLSEVQVAEFRETLN
jgi:hypothetical protein